MMQMYLKILLFALLSVMGVGDVACAAQDPLVLKPLTQWVVNYSDDSCRLLRQFGSEGDTVTLIMDRFVPGDGLNLTLVGSPFNYDGLTREISVQFGSGEQVQNRSFYSGNFGKAVPAIILPGSLTIGKLTDVEVKLIEKNTALGKPQPTIFGPEREAAVTYILIGTPLRQPVRLETGPMQKPLAALNTCIDDLVTSWGIDVQKHKALSKTVTPIGSQGNWITTEDYPKAALSSGGQAFVYARLSIDETGKPTACHIQQSTQGKGFGDAVCAGLMRRAKFKPALDAESKPIASYFRKTVFFSIPSN